MRAEEFQSLVLEGVRPPETPFTPSACYDSDGDCIEFLASPESFYGERIDPVVTVFYGNESGEVVGTLIKGVKSLLRNNPKLLITVIDGRVRIDHLLLANAVSSDLGEIVARTYQKLVAMAAEQHASVAVPKELCQV